MEGSGESENPITKLLHKFGRRTTIPNATDVPLDEVDLLDHTKKTPEAIAENAGELQQKSVARERAQNNPPSPDEGRDVTLRTSNNTAR